ncbi:MAG: MvaI/BcnI family restriction endonuclease [Hyphomicrobiales bacterium]
MLINNYPTEKKLKQLVKKLAKTKNIKISEAYEDYSNEMNSSSWREFKPLLEAYWKNKQQTKTVNKYVDENMSYLTRLGVVFSIFEPTATGFDKSILDATHQVRTHFELENFHHYYSQDLGPKHKVIKEAQLLTSENDISSRVSLYRPKTKNGDPRMWFKHLNKLAEAKDKVAVIILNDKVYLINISKTLISSLLSLPDSPVTKFLKLYINVNTSVSKELLAKLRILAKKPFKALRTGDTAIGYTLETLLGIPANSNKLPDYKGIEIKSGRGGKNRTTLFAQVANWKKSPCKKSAEILDKYGYQKDGDDRLYCTINAKRSNSQGLSFKLNNSGDLLEEHHDKDGLVAVWDGNILRKRLLEKHAETFWVEAESTKIAGVEHFQLKSVIHTKKPISIQFLSLIEAGIITMDHLIKRSGNTNRVSEKGPLFKINKRDLSLLFPEPTKYTLI